ncbi:protein phosphatase 2C domain-containing protein [Glutamicibacter protophormiae]|uniref:Serine/threonine phosphatase stp n=1 Tax=Kocuria varians TaxID=1272 RepID=A0A7D7Q587_KOCVA|nr:MULTISPECIES: protein phosphatase 2C domain-containing protein [Kocuria]WNB87719.1 protein phosphatase 2C domain-containing protein [Glutamicibacter protophormiae]MDN5632214.1 protein phosphatase 2C domain-containing protein [Kocuria sp.]QMS56700.1 Serine/threonine phosphatase stp [Kocuria varians]RUP83547.1 serine/threonine-protein phosphatase [Kocuria sp. HSID17590]RUQ02945.1 serine/threonine-protein phosphatase [Kocuria sp. HSID17582]
MSEALTIRSGGVTDRGLRRETNEDALIVTDTMCAVADGMGGHEAGEVASALCVATLGASELFSLDDFHDYRIVEPEPGSDVARFRATIDRQLKLDPDVPNGALDAVHRVRSVLWEADQAIQAQCGTRAGTTVTGAWLVEIEGTWLWIVFNVGDSRTYQLTGPLVGEDVTATSGPVGVTQLTVDHSEVQYLVSIGQLTPAQALVHPRRNVITRALGTGQIWEPDVIVVPAVPGQRLLMCSDGLTGELSPAHIARVLHSVRHPKEAADVLVQAALRTGGRDNVTLVVADVLDAEDPAAHTSTIPRVR